MRKGISIKLLIASLTLIALAHLPMCSNSGTTPVADSIDPGEGGQISLETPEVHFYPQDKRPNVITNTNIELYFSVDMDQENDWKVWINNDEYNRFSAGIAWERRALTIRPAQAFPQGMPVTVEAEGFVSTAGVGMPGRAVTFTVVQYDESTVTITPALLTAASGGTAAHPLSDVKLEFNQLVLSNNGWSVTIDEIPFSQSSPGISWNKNVLTINPAGYFAPGAHVEIEAKGFITAYGAMIVQETGGSFEVDAAALPTIAFDPSASADPVSRRAPLKLSFTETVIQDGDWEVVLDGLSYSKDSPDIRWVDGELFVDHADVPLSEGVQVTAQANGFVADDGYPFENASVTFPVKAKPGITGDPAQDQLKVSIKTPITLAFDEPVNQDGAWQVSIDGTVYSKSLNSAAWAWQSDRKLVIDHSPDFTLGQKVYVAASGFQTSAFPVAFEDLDYYFIPSEIPVDDVVLGDTEIDVVIGDSVTLTAEIIPSNASTKSVKWKSLNEGVATVDQSGKVTGVAKGTTVVTVTTDDGGHTDECAVTVLAPRDIAVFQGGAELPDGTGSYAFTGYTKIDHSSAPATFVVKNEGDIELTIYSVEPPTGSLFTVEAVPMPVILAPGATAEFSVTFNPVAEGTHEDVITIASDDPDDENPYELTVRGEAIRNPLMWSVPNGGEPVIQITTSISLNFSEPVDPGCGWEVAITSGGSNVVFDSNWESNTRLILDPSTDFTADQEVRLVANGFVTLNADPEPVTFNDLDFTFTPVKVPVTGIILNPTVAAIDLDISATRQLTASVEPVEATYQNVTWASSNEGIATVNTVGLVTAVSKGTAAITATSVDNPAVTASCEIIVQNSGEPGHKEVVTIDETPVVITYIPQKTTFPIGTDDSGTGTVAGDYQLGETEVTFEQWSAVYGWAVGHGYAFANAGSGSTGAHPVTHVNWRDAIVWCNAFTEFYNSQNEPDLTCVYKYSGSIIRDSRDANATACDNAAADASATGFRLPTSMEWELAARWRNDATNTKAGYASPWFTKGNSLSHATANYQNNAASYLVGVFYTYYDNTLTGVTGTMPAKSREPNSLGLYDMSGNVWELCFDKDGGGPKRLMRGGSWCNKTDMLQLGVVNSVYPYDASPGVGPYVGFRVAKKKQ